MNAPALPGQNPKWPAAEASAPRDVSRWRIGELELDEATLELRLRGELLTIERKPLELLMWLLRHPGEVITKEELFDALWTGRVVTDSVLTKCVAKLRLAIRDDTQAVLKTVHGFGYRLVAPVHRLGAHDEPPLPSGPQLEPQTDASALRGAGLQVGDSPPQRPNWRLQQRFAGSRGENWLAVHTKSGEKRVFKFALCAAGLSQLKREVTLNRLLRDTLGPRDDFARVLDWNLEEAPYFVELAHCSEGSLIDWLDGQGGAGAVPLALRLELVAQTADALAAAHSAGVLHKDVKPGNVLIERCVDGQPRVCLGDFGSARMLDARQLQALRITRMGFTQPLTDEQSTSGTWIYLAPELVAGLPPTVRSDIFALGVLLYQLVVGDLKRSLAPGWERLLDDPLLCEDVAACCDQAPERRLGDAAELSRRLRRLDERRAELLSQARADAELILTRQALDRARQRRGWLRGLAGVATAAALGIGVLYLQVREARDDAARHALEAGAIRDFLIKDLIAAANPSVSGVAAVSVRDVLASAEAQLAHRFAAQPDREAALRLALAQARLGIGDYAQAAAGFEAVADGPADARTRLQAWLGLSQARIDLAEDAAAAAAVEAARPVLAALPGGDPTLRLHFEKQAAVLEHLRGSASAAATALAALRPRFEAHFGAAGDETLRLLAALGSALTEAGRVDESLALQRQALALTEQSLGPDHVRSLTLRFDTAQTLLIADRVAESEAAHRETYERARRALGDEHLTTISVGHGWANTLPREAKSVQGRALIETLLATAHQRFGADHLTTQGLMNSLALVMGDSGERERERALYRQLLESQRRTMGPDHLYTLITLHNLARSHQRSAQFQQALTPAIEAHDRGLASLGSDNVWVCVFATRRAHLLSDLGHRDEARTLVAPCAVQLQAQFGADHMHTRNALTVLEQLNLGAQSIVRR
jgi:eukaryotic-like serine/threonine-protein kinase